MNEPFYEEELLYRAVLPDKVFWKENGKLSSAAFKIRKGENGISVDRQMRRSNEECISFILQKLRGKVIAVTVSDVYNCEAKVLSDPIPDEDEYHSLIIKTEDNVGLSKGQARKLAEASRVVYHGD